jgi:hypothetical protein
MQAHSRCGCALSLTHNVQAPVGAQRSTLWAYPFEENKTTTVRRTDCDDHAERRFDFHVKPRRSPVFNQRIACRVFAAVTFVCLADLPSQASGKEKLSNFIKVNLDYL